MTEDVALVRIRSGDVVVFRCDAVLSDGARTRAREILEATFPENEILMLERGQGIEIVRPTRWWHSLWPWNKK